MALSLFTHSLLDRDALHPETSLLVHGTDVRETKKVKRLRFGLSLAFSFSCRITAEFNELGLLP